jgi:transcriptional regulator with XRE-family HTH domain
MSARRIRGQGERAAPWAARLRERRRAAGLTQDELAGLAVVSTGTIRDIEQGRVARPRPASVSRLAAVLGVDTGAVTQPAPAAWGSFPDPAGQLPGFWLGVLGALTVCCDGVEVDRSGDLGSSIPVTSPMAHQSSPVKIYPHSLAIKTSRADRCPDQHPKTTLHGFECSPPLPVRRSRHTAARLAAGS